MQSCSQLVTTNKPTPRFLQARCPSYCPSDGVRALKGSHMHDTMSSWWPCDIQVIQMFRGCHPEDMPPHIYAVAQTAYRSLLATRRDQSVVLMGRSGSGKTTNARHVMQYYLVSAGCVNGAVTSKISSSLRCTLASGAVYCNRSCLFVCVCLCVFVCLLP